MNMRYEEQCKGIINKAALKAGAVGFGTGGTMGIALAGVDIGATTAIQIRMIKQLGDVFNKSITESLAKGLLSSYVSQQAGRKVAGFLAGRIPVLGKVINAGVGASATEGLGWFVAEHFSNN